MEEKIRGLVRSAILKLSLPEADFNVEHPADLSHGDYSTNVAMVLAGEVKSNTKDLAERIKESIGVDENVEKVEVAGAGFLNFYLSKSFFVDSVKEVIENESNYGKNTFLQEQKTIVEYTDPNPFKKFHIGHLMSNTIGESISRLVEAQGAEVKRSNYQGDVGLHVAKAVWAKMNDPKISWGEAYARGSREFNKSEEIKKEIRKLNKKIYDRSDQDINRIYDDGRRESLADFEIIYERLGTEFDLYFLESETAEFGKDTVSKNTGGWFKKGVFKKSDGAVIFPGEKYGLHNRVFINSEGLPTYEAKELGLAKLKYERYQYDKSIVITGNEINEYFKVVLKTMEIIFPDLAKKTTHISHGMLRLPTGKMSSRTGDVIPAEDLIEEAKKKVVDKISDRELSKEEKEEISETVAIGAIKYSILKQSPGKDIIFDFDKSLSLEGDSGPYLQYTYTRAKSVLKNAETKLDFDYNGEIFDLERVLYKFPEVVKKAGDEYLPQYLVTYLISLASEFNSFYNKGKISDSPYKLALTQSVATILENGLNLLGIRTLDKM